MVALTEPAARSFAFTTKTAVQSGCYAQALPTELGQGKLAEIQQAKIWIQKCEKSHVFCSERTRKSEHWNPTRLVAVGSKTDPPRLVHELPHVVEYLALSHCWGVGVITYMLTEETQDDMLRAIPVEQLTQTVNDALELTRALGYEYLWVDYLCILQDSNEDWDREARMMHEVYAQATCTIAASHASDGSYGLFSPRNWNSIIPKAIQSQLNGRDFHHIPCDGTMYKEITQSPLNDRAWTYQEMILSSRILHFGPERIFWSCSTHNLSYSFPHYSPLRLFHYPLGSDSLNSYTTIRARAAHNYFEVQGQNVMHGFIPNIYPRVSPNDIILDETLGKGNFESLAIQRSQYVPASFRRNFHRHLWNQIVKEYSQRQLTRESDRPIAIAGIAKEMELVFGSSVVCGHPVDDLYANLLWRPGESTCRRKDGIPSWSWLSVLGMVEPYLDGTATLGSKILIDRCQMAKDSLDLSTAVLKLRGRIAEAFLDRDSLIYLKQPGTNDAGKQRLRRSGLDAMCDYPSEVFTTRQDIVRQDLVELFLLQTGGYGKAYDVDTPKACGLILEKSEQSQTFSRLGIFYGNDISQLLNAFELFDSSPESSGWASARIGQCRVYEVNLV